MTSNTIIAFKLIEADADEVRRLLEQIQGRSCPDVGNGVTLPQLLSVPEVNNCLEYRITIANYGSS